MKSSPGKTQTMAPPTLTDADLTSAQTDASLSRTKAAQTTVEVSRSAIRDLLSKAKMNSHREGSPDAQSPSAVTLHTASRKWSIVMADTLLGDLSSVGSSPSYSPTWSSSSSSLESPLSSSPSSKQLLSGSTSSGSTSCDYPAPSYSQVDGSPIHSNVELSSSPVLGSAEPGRSPSPSGVEKSDSIPVVQQEPVQHRHNLESALPVGPTPEGGNSTSKPCAVCGESTKGFYYGAVACLPCKTFFVRYSGQTRLMKCRIGTRSCDINEATRVSCKACRYAKCLRVGMERKDRSGKQLPTEGQQLCCVCGDVSNGLHFGVFTCEGCKKFFRRGLEEHRTYKCKRSTQCMMNPNTRKLCRLCRFKRCINVGMSLQGIRFGRRRKDRDPQAGIHGSSSDEDRLQQGSPLVGAASHPSLTTHTPPQDIHPHPHHHISSRDSPPSPHGISDRSPSDSPIPTEIGYSQRIFCSGGHLTVNTPSYASNLNSPLLMDTSDDSDPHNQHYGGAGLRCDAPETNSPEHRVLPVKGEDLKETPSDNRKPLSEVIQYWQRSVPLEVTAMTGSQRDLISTVLGLYEPQKLSFTAGHNEKTVNTLPGLMALGDGNVDDGIVQNITNFVIFAKALPGFDKLDPSDQYTLIRLGSIETPILSSAVFEMRSLDVQLEDARVQRTPNHFKFLKTTLNITKTVRLLNLDAVESCLLFILCLIATDRPGLNDVGAISHIRQQYISAMASYIEENQGDAFSRLSAIFSVMPRVRQMGVWYYKLTSAHAVPSRREAGSTLFQHGQYTHHKGAVVGHQSPQHTLHEPNRPHEGPVVGNQCPYRTQHGPCRSPEKAIVADQGPSYIDHGPCKPHTEAVVGDQRPHYTEQPYRLHEGMEVGEPG